MSDTKPSICFIETACILTSQTLQMLRLTIRATDESVPAVLLKLMETRVAAGESTRPVRDDDEGPTRQDISSAFSNVMVT